ncbi:hypothetical protein N018_20560 [Pseudomonas syringae CC1557]|uniref:MarR family transcriptional regulator n=1 Tax=Pseudomonas syringae CC1557 TaxID=1357279 RepID=W0MVN9_PSESX|nr:hypothetical protein [Pseudomonas syringae]AHG42487.1 hypothetical protein N018_20560 [Pseudomonas syringae CC1557]
MPVSPDDIRLYLEATLGMDPELKPANEIKVPHYIKDTYNLVNLTLLGHGEHRQSKLDMVLLLPLDDEYPGSVTLGKHIFQVQKNTDKTVVYACQSLSASERRSLITRHINFIQPGYQMFIPELAMDLRESVRTRRLEGDVPALLPAAQAMVLGCLYEGWDSATVFASNAIMGEFNYSRVTLAKVIDQLLKLGIVHQAQRHGFKNLYSFAGPPTDIFKKYRHVMRSPVRRKVAINKVLRTGNGIFLAGESALARLTMLADPAMPIFGMTKKQFDTLLEDKDIRVVNSVDEVRAWVEIWTYRSLGEQKKIADEASLFLSMEGSPDERIQLALDELKENVTWLKFGA